MRQILYRQCTLTQGNKTQVSWIPDKYCIVGRGIQFKENDEWSDRWVVESFGEPTDSPPDWRKLIKSHRKGTGDSLSKRDVVKL